MVWKIQFTQMAGAQENSFSLGFPGSRPRNKDARAGSRRAVPENWVEDWKSETGKEGGQ